MSRFSSWCLKINCFVWIEFILDLFLEEMGFLEYFGFVVINNHLSNYVRFFLFLGIFSWGFVLFINFLLRNLNWLRWVGFGRLGWDWIQVGWLRYSLRFNCLDRVGVCMLSFGLRLSLKNCGLSDIIVPSPWEDFEHRGFRGTWFGGEATAGDRVAWHWIPTEMKYKILTLGIKL